jgi:ligand-binding sensor domain-containing protein
VLYHLTRIFVVGQCLKRLRLLTCLGLIVGSSSQSALAQYRFDVWTADNGLPQNAVYAILQTRDGYLWFTTLDGSVFNKGVTTVVCSASDTSNNTASCSLTVVVVDAQAPSIACPPSIVRTTARPG